MSKMEIDKNSPIPAYYQIEMDLLARISRHEWYASQQLPTEIELAQQYNVSRVTLRQALAELEKDGVIRKERGKGAFLQSEPKPFINNLSYSLVTGERLTGQSHCITAQILNRELVTELYPDICENLHLQPEDSATFIKRLFLLNGKPLAIGRSYFSAAAVPGLDAVEMIDNSLSRTLATRYGIVADHVEDTLEVVRCTQAESNLLHCSNSSPLLLVRGLSYTSDDRPLEYSSTLWSGDSVRFRLTLRNTGHGFFLEA